MRFALAGKCGIFGSSGFSLDELPSAADSSEMMAGKSDDPATIDRNILRRLCDMNSGLLMGVVPCAMR